MRPFIQDFRKHAQHGVWLRKSTHREAPMRAFFVPASQTLSRMTACRHGLRSAILCIMFETISYPCDARHWKQDRGALSLDKEVRVTDTSFSDSPTHRHRLASMLLPALHSHKMTRTRLPHKRSCSWLRASLRLLGHHTRRHATPGRYQPCVHIVASCSAWTTTHLYCPKTRPVVLRPVVLKARPP